MKPTNPTLLSLFCGCGGLDLGFEQVGFTTGLAYDQRADAVSSWNRNRNFKSARTWDVRQLSLDALDLHYGCEFLPAGVIGGPPCQGFSLANRRGHRDDPRNDLAYVFVKLALDLHKRQPLNFVVIENVPAVVGKRGGSLIDDIRNELNSAEFDVRQIVLDAAHYGVPQRRKRFFLIATNNHTRTRPWMPPKRSTKNFTVRDAIFNLPEPQFYNGKQTPLSDVHQNHWCMVPKSKKFQTGELIEGYKEKRSFKTLSWDEPSYTVSYGNREVHIHPAGKRRLSVFEALLLQGFPSSFCLDGTLSSQITQVSEAVPPPLARAVAESVAASFQTPSATSDWPSA